MEARQPIQSAVVVADAPGADLQSYGGLIGDAELRVGADGGAQHLLEAGFLPHIVIGDFDSLAPATLAELEAWGIAIERD